MNQLIRDWGTSTGIKEDYKTWVRFAVNNTRFFEEELHMTT